ncbi:hypothetical protein ACTFIY_009605 [Dictyostelium cf. discoideum]
MNPQLPLTHVQQQILEYIEKSIERTGVSPSYREVMQALGYKSTGSVHRLIEILKQKGHLAQFKPQVWRSFSPLRLKKIEPVEVEGYQRSKPSTFQEPERIVAPDSLSFSVRDHWYDYWIKDPRTYTVYFTSFEGKGIAISYNWLIPCSAKALISVQAWLSRKKVLVAQLVEQ